MQMSNSGFVAIKTDHFIIYGSYSSTMFPSVCVEAMESLGRNVTSAINTCTCILNKLLNETTPLCEGPDIISLTHAISSDC